MSDIIGITPFEHADAGLVAALCRAGALGVLDLGRRPEAASTVLADLARQGIKDFGVRVAEGVEVLPQPLPEGVRTVVVGAGADLGRWRPRSVLVQVTSIEEAREAAHAGADGLIAKGSESGGRVGEETSLVLLQRIARELSLPIWVQGGVGLHTAAACLAGGAKGVVLDSQLALVRESSLPESVRAAVAGMDGSETAVVEGYRILSRPDLPSANAKEAALGDIAAKLGASDLRRFLLPAGQDTAFARPFAEQFRTAGGVVGALRRAIAGHLRQAKELRLLAPGAAFAADHGIRYPIAQGPMTRVSDRAAFADAVSRAGGLPFLALALMRGDEVRELLRETASLLGDRAWGVGILGFVPREIREEQLAILREIRPPVALVAGGRPSQVRPLETQGTTSYLHVPSPGLLDLFLADGARRFVFEGRECGGHVGPRTSFVLWEQQIERLLAFEAPHELSVLFAGGVHDARSAAMVATMAAPLAAAGAKVGVLMGTAYLFTQEAIATGAIQPGFQEAAKECDRTVLLETAPGHATRCVDTEYVRTFLAEKCRLEEQGWGAQEVWDALEKLNLGRLRIASKGLKREGDRLVSMDEAAQRRDGMYLIGQVAALRSQAVSTADLHAEVTEGATQILDRLEIPGTAAEARARAGARAGIVERAEVAIIGIACIFPGAPDRHAFWSNIVLGVDSIAEVPPERWDQDLYYDPLGTGEKSRSKWGGFLPPTPFDPLSYGIPPRSLAAIEPVQLLALEVARRALEDAGYRDRPFDREHTSVIFGAEAGTDLSNAYGFRALYPQYLGRIPKALDEHLPKLTEDSFPGVLTNVIAGRIANRLDLGGVNYTVDAACAASLAAVDLAVKELRAGTSHLVLCGGADLHNTINDYLLFSSVQALSPTGRCKTFDADADGIVLGEGVACLVLKRLEDALEEGDRVYAVIQGVGGSSDGKSLGLTAPRKEGQVRALERAYRMAGVSPAEVGLVEAHGTGTVVGDRTELSTLTEVFGRSGAQPGSCALGSVKSQIGHTKCAAGLAGLIKSALALYHRVLPPTLHIRRPNPFYDASQSPFLFHDAARPWPDEERKAAVSAFGFGGTNFHVVLSAHDQASGSASGSSRWPSELFLFRAPDRAAATARIRHLEALLAKDDRWRLADLAKTVSTDGGGPVQVAVVAKDLPDLRAKLACACEFASDKKGVFVRRIEPGKVAFLFPGQGSQRPGMLAELFVAFPGLQRLLALGGRWRDRMFPGAASTPEERAAQAQALTDTRVAQPALGIADLAMAELLGSLGVKPDLLGGHSYGELVALCVAGVLPEPDLLALSEARAQFILDAAGRDPGGMAAVSAGAGQVAEALQGQSDVVIANLNAPDQTVVSGPTPAIDVALARLQASGLGARKIPVACAFHSPVVAAAREALSARLAGMPVASPRVPVWSNSTAELYPADPEAVRVLLAGQVALPVQFAEEIESMYRAGARVFVEVGPGQVLTSLVGRILGARPHLAVACDRDGERGLTQLQTALAELAVHGIPVEAAPLYAGRDASLLDLDHPPRLTPSPTAWIVDGQTARPVEGELPPHAMRPITQPLAPRAATPPAAMPAHAGARAARPPTPAASSDRDAVVIEYLRSMRELVDAERQVMLHLLGEFPGRKPVEPLAGLPEPALPATRPAEKLRVTAEEQAPAAPPRPAGSIADLLVAVVGERTGYPTEMLGLDLDMEADLGIDSIKRVEILGLLTSRLGLVDLAIESRDEIIEHLAAVKTLRGIIEWFERSRGSAPKAAVHAFGVARYLFSVERATPAAADGAHLSGLTFALTRDDRGVAERLSALLQARGATIHLMAPGEPVGKVEGLIHLASLAPDPSLEAAKALFELVRQAILGGVSRILGATGLGGAFGRGSNGGALPLHGAGVSGLLKTVAKEHPDLRVRAVDLDLTEEPGRLAEQLLAELLCADELIEVGYQGGRRQVLGVRPARELEENARRELSLNRDSVILLTGGARGITSCIAIALAERFGCRLELVGRSPLPPETDPDDPPGVSAAPDLPSLRRALAIKGTFREPAAIEAACARILTAREIRGTLSEIRRTGASATYHALDVRDADALRALIGSIYARHGRLDGVVHAAGVLEDKLLTQKTGESFARVFDTKVKSALTLSEALRSDVGFLVFFSSVSGAFGNRGQVDYAAANDALDKLALALSKHLPGRVISINWGPWAGNGMVSPELGREYARRGIGLLPPAEGVAAFLDELSRERPDAQIVLMRTDPTDTVSFPLQRIAV